MRRQEWQLRRTAAQGLACCTAAAGLAPFGNHAFECDSVVAPFVSGEVPWDTLRTRDTLRVANAQAERGLLLKQRARGVNGNGNHEALQLGGVGSEMGCDGEKGGTD